MSILDEITKAWSWMSVQPRALIMQNEFGNVVFIDDDGRYWRICPEELSCEIIATSLEEFTRLKNDDNFLRDWTMQELVERARSSLGPLSADRCYCLKIPAALSGDYTPHNIGAIDRAELISASGHLAQQIKDLPDGTQIKLSIID